MWLFDKLKCDCMVKKIERFMRDFMCLVPHLSLKEISGAFLRAWPSVHLQLSDRGRLWANVWGRRLLPPEHVVTRSSATRNNPSDVRDMCVCVSMAFPGCYHKTMSGLRWCAGLNGHGGMCADFISKQEKQDCFTFKESKTFMQHVSSKTEYLCRPCRNLHGGMKETNKIS